MILVGIGGKKIDFSSEYRIFFADKNPQMAAFDKIEKVYTKTDNVIFTIKANSGDLFNERHLRLIQELTKDAWQLPYSRRVDSLTNFQHSFAIEDDLNVIDLFEKDPSDYTNKEIESYKNIALNEPLISGKLISKDGKTTGINVLVNLPRKKMEETPEVANAARKLVDKYIEKYPDVSIHPSGFVFLNNAFVENSMQDMAKLMPLMFLVLLIIMIFFIRSFTATFCTLIVVILSALAAMTFGGWIGVLLTPVSAITPTIVLTLAVADSIHIILSLKKGMTNGLTKNNAIKETIRINFQPVFLTSITTIIGFLSLNFSESPPFWHLGNMTAFGIGAAFFYSIFLLPALLRILPIGFKKKKQIKESIMIKLASLVIKFYKPFLIISVLSTILIGVMIKKIEINDRFVQYFDQSISFRPDTEFMMRNLSGIYEIDFSISSKGSEQITDPGYLNKLEDFSNWLKVQPQVDHVFSVSDIFKRLNKNMHQDKESMYTIPDRQDMAAQYLLLYELSLPYGLDLNDRINIDKSSTRLTVTVKDLSTNELRAFKAKAENWLKQNAPDYMSSEGTSPAVMFSFISDRNIKAMVKGNIFSLILISLIILVFLKSIKIGLISLIPNLTPLLLGFGLWGLLIGQINMAVAFAFAVCLGIIVDDTVHFLSKYLRARREKKLEAPEAIKYAFDTVGNALVITTVVLIGGFLVLSQSGFQMNAYLGMLASIVIGSALFLDFFLLPPFLLLIEKLKNKEKEL